MGRDGNWWNIYIVTGRDLCWTNVWSSDLRDGAGNGDIYIYIYYAKGPMLDCCIIRWPTGWGGKWRIYIYTVMRRDECLTNVWSGDLRDGVENGKIHMLWREGTYSWIVYGRVIYGTGPDETGRDGRFLWETRIGRDSVLSSRYGIFVEYSF